MKYLFLLLLLACGKTTYKPVPSSPELQAEIMTVEEDFSKFDPSIDVMVAFLWPEKITTAAQRKSVRTIINSSRELKTSKDEYYEKKLTLQRRYRKESCDCNLNSLCEEGQEPGPIDACLKIEEATFANDKKLIAIIEIVEGVKKEVLGCGGEWLDTQSDLTDLPMSTIDLSTMRLNLSAFGSHKKEGVVIPYAYELSELSYSRLPTYGRLQTTFPRQSSTGRDWGTFEFDLGVKSSKTSLTFQGDLLWHYRGKKRSGIIYWENPLKSF